MNILYTCDDKFCAYTGISITSLFENNKDLDEINVFIAGQDISEKNKTGLEKTALDLPLARWNPLFDKTPPLSVRAPKPVIDESELVPAQSEPLINTIIDISQLVPVEQHRITVIIQEGSLVSADEQPTLHEVTPIISELFQSEPHTP